jgi:hypothetical protein
MGEVTLEKGSDKASPTYFGWLCEQAKPLLNLKGCALGKLVCQ